MVVLFNQNFFNFFCVLSTNLFCVLSGVQKVLFKCYRQNDQVDVDNGNCDVKVQPKTGDKVCDLGTCPPTYSWRSVNSSCSATCGKGNIIMVVLIETEH